MNLTRGAHTFALLAALLFLSQFIAPTQARAAQTPGNNEKRELSVLLIGNSHLLMPGFAKKLKRQLAEGDRKVDMKIVAKIGTTLTKSRKKAATRTAMRSKGWDVIVLQESTTAFMTKHGRRNFMSAVEWFDQNKPGNSKLLLWQPWPQGASHALYARRGVWGRWFKNPPRNPKQLFSWISEGVRRAADKRELVISPIGHCWMSLPKRKRPYAGDDYHPSNRGLTFIAKTLASSVQATASDQQATNTRRIGACP